MIRIGTAGWAIPRPVSERFPPAPSNLARYAGLFRAAEINSSFHRPHRPVTYARWADSVPDNFQFAVKLPRAVTHDKRLVNAQPELAIFVDQARHLGPKLGPLLVQLPPSLAFDPVTAREFFRGLRD